MKGLQAPHWKRCTGNMQAPFLIVLTNAKQGKKACASPDILPELTHKMVTPVAWHPSMSTSCDIREG